MTSPILKEGYLWKECTFPLSGKQIKKKWVVLSDDKLYCYKSNKNDLTNTFDTNKILTIHQSSSKSSFQFEISYSKGTKRSTPNKILFEAASNNDMLHWIMQIRSTINTSSSTLSSFNNIPTNITTNINTNGMLTLKKNRDNHIIDSFVTCS